MNVYRRLRSRICWETSLYGPFSHYEIFKHRKFSKASALKKLTSNLTPNNISFSSFIIRSFSGGGASSFQFRKSTQYLLHKNRKKNPNFENDDQSYSNNNRSRPRNMFRRDEFDRRLNNNNNSGNQVKRNANFSNSIVDAFYGEEKVFSEDINTEYLEWDQSVKSSTPSKFPKRKTKPFHFSSNSPKLRYEITYDHDNNRKPSLRRDRRDSQLKEGKKEKYL